MIVGAPENVANAMSQERGFEGSKWDSLFERLFLENYGRVVKVLFRLLGDRSRAEELAGDVFWKLYRRPLFLNLDGNLSGWLYRTATNLGIDLLRSTSRRKHYEHEAGRAQLEGDAPGDPLGEILRREKRRRVQAVLASLKPAQAKILVLRASGFSYKELADSLGIKKGSVGTMLIRAEAEFQKRYLRKYGSKEEP